MYVCVCRREFRVIVCTYWGVCVSVIFLQYESESVELVCR